MKVDFSTAFMADTFVLISKKPTPLGTDFWFILKPLSWGLWLASIIAWVAATVCIALPDYADERGGDPYGSRLLIHRAFASTFPTIAGGASGPGAGGETSSPICTTLLSTGGEFPGEHAQVV